MSMQLLQTGYNINTTDAMMSQTGLSRAGLYYFLLFDVLTGLVHVNRDLRTTTNYKIIKCGFDIGRRIIRNRRKTIKTQKREETIRKMIINVQILLK